MYYELSKADKKIARLCIEKGIDAEFREGLEKCEAVVGDWRAGKFSGNKEAYHKLFQALREKDRAIARRYDGLSGSRWLGTVAAILRDGFISEEDVAGFSDEARITIERWNRVQDE